MKNKELIDKLTLQEKASLMSGKDFWETQAIASRGVPSVFLADGPHGVRKQAAGGDHIGYNPSLAATCYPLAAAMANSWDEELGFQLGEHLGKEAAAQDVSVLLGPGVNIKRNPLCGRNFEYFSEDPYLAGKMAAAYIRGIQSNGIYACVKHFAANNQEDNRMVINTVADERTLREIYLTAFEIAVKEGGVRAVMTAYNRVNGDYANENVHLLREILRGEWGFDGLVVTDWGGSNDRVQGLIAGSDLEMPGTGGETNQEIVDAVKCGMLDEAVLDESVDRVLTMLRETSEEKRPAEFDVDAHHDMARKAAEGSIVLLKNKDAVLPLNPSSRVAVIGDFAFKPRYQGAGSSGVNPTRLDNFLQCIGRSDVRFTGYAPGFKRYGGKSEKLKRDACRLAQKADVVLLFMGLDEVTETEGFDRVNMKIPANQISLLDALTHTGKKIVVVLSSGSALETDWADCTDALVHTYLSGQAGAGALLNILTGRVNPSGKLAESYPITYGDTPSARNFHRNDLSVEYREGVFVGYRYYDTVGAAVRYPFGFGLSYTTFAYSNIDVTDRLVAFDLENSGKRAGAEIAQLYIGMPDSGIFRPSKELKGFCKAFLQPGEKTRIEIPFDDKSFRYFNPAVNQWETEAGVYEIMIGASSADIRLRACVELKGTTNVQPYKISDLPTYYSGQVADVGTAEFETLIGRNVPSASLTPDDFRRAGVGVNTTVAQLRYAKGWTGRVFEGGIRFAYHFLRLIGQRFTAMMLMVSLYQEPMRGLSRMTNGAIRWGQLEGLLLMFNGHFFKGLARLFRERRKSRIIKYNVHVPNKGIKVFQNISQLWLLRTCAQGWKKFKTNHPAIAQFLVFFMISNGMTVLQLVMMPAFKALFGLTNLVSTNFQVWPVGQNFDGSVYYIFNYAHGSLSDGGGGGLAYFLAVQITLLIAQIINFFAQRNITFRSNGNPWRAALWYAMAYVAISIGAAALQGLYKAPIYNLFITTWAMGKAGETMADVITMIIYCAISFWVFFPIFRVIFKNKEEKA